MKSIWIRAGLAGYFISGAWSSLAADFMGMVKYLQWIQDHWIDASITVPLAIAVWVICIRVLTNVIKDEAALRND